MVTDFQFDGIKLSDLGYSVVSFESAKDGEIDTDSQFSFNHLSIMRGKYQPFITSVYEDPLKMTFYIAKNPCSSTDKVISISEMELLKTTLVRPTPKELFVYSDSDDYSYIFWVGSFNLEEYVVGDKRVGALLTFECDAPYGYGTYNAGIGTLIGNSSMSFDSASDEIGYVYPSLRITLDEDGDLELYNSADGRTTKVNNCTNGEVLTFTKNLQLTSSVSSHDVLDDFNFVFYRVNRKFGSATNTLETNLDIQYSFNYLPIAKVVIV